MSSEVVSSGGVVAHIVLGRKLGRDKSLIERDRARLRLTISRIPAEAEMMMSEDLIVDGE
jgi:hypothetical protein